MVGCNWDDAITSPPFYEKYFLPELEKVIDLMHGRDKLTTFHVDGI